MLRSFNISLLYVAIVILFSPTAFGAVSGMKLQSRAESKYLGFIKVYNASLYTRQTVSAENILAEETSRCLKLDYAVSIKAADFARGADAILSRQHDPATVAAVKAEIDKLHQAYRDVKKGDAYRLCYEAQSRDTTLFLNEEKLISITSAQFAEIYFGIWLGARAPIDENLRDKLLSPLRPKPLE